MATSKEEIKEQQKEVGKYAVIEGLLNSEGGKTLFAKHEMAVADAIDKIISSFKTATHSELIAYSAILAERITIVRMFMRAPKNRAGAAAELDRMLKDVDAENESGG